MAIRYDMCHLARNMCAEVMAQSGMGMLCHQQRSWSLRLVSCERFPVGTWASVSKGMYIGHEGWGPGGGGGGDGDRAGSLTPIRSAHHTRRLDA